ncbi:MAG: hypothetical protein ACKOAX_04360 [Candidatus Kapaibacterium sp.]
MKAELLRLSYVKVDSSHMATDSIGFTVVNRADTIPDRFVYRNSYYANRGFKGLQDIRRVGATTLVAAGDANMIAISVDDGASWRFVSVFKVQYQGRDQLQVLDSNRLYVLDGPIVYGTTDGGTTWLPPIYTHCPALDAAGLESFSLRPDGRLILKFSSWDTLAANVLVAGEPSERLRFIARDSACAYFDTTHKEYVYHTDTPVAIPFKDGFIQISTQVVYFVGGRYIKRSSVIFLDSQLVMRAVRLFADTSSLIGIVRMDNNSIHAIGLKGRGNNLFDSLGQTSEYRYRYFLARLDEQSEQWVREIDSLPFQQSLLQSGGKYRYINSIDEHCRSRKEIIYCRNAEGTLYTIDVATNATDSVQMPVRFTSTRRNGLEVDGDSVRYVGRNQVIYSSRSESFITWDSTDLRRSIGNWDAYDYVDNPRGTDNVGKVVCLYGRQSYIQTISEGDPGFRWFGLVRVTETGGISPAEERDNPDPYLSCSPWYPHPAFGLTSTNVSWDNPSTAGTPDVDLIDMFGHTVAPGRLSSVLTGDHSLRVTCNTSGLTRGVYVARITHGQTVTYRPLIVN